MPSTSVCRSEVTHSHVIENADQPITGATQEIMLSCHRPSTLSIVGGAIPMAVLVIVPIAMAIVLTRWMRARTAPA